MFDDGRNPIWLILRGLCYVSTVFRRFFGMTIFVLLWASSLGIWSKSHYELRSEEI